MPVHVWNPISAVKVQSQSATVRGFQTDSFVLLITDFARTE